MPNGLNENTRVQVPAAIHLVRLGYSYLSDIKEEEYDHSTNILKDVFLERLKAINPQMTDSEAEGELKRLVGMCRDNDDLGKEFFQTIISKTGIKYIDFEHPENNAWHVTTEFTCENERTKDNFRPDITIFVNGLPLVFIEVKKPLNQKGMIVEKERSETRCHNSAFKSFFNITQFMIFSNNEEYNDNDMEKVKGSYYATPSKDEVFFSLFREEDKQLYDKVCIRKTIDPDTERQILFHRNCPQIKSHPEYQSNLNPNTPCNRILTSMLSRERLLFLLQYGLVYVNHTVEVKRESPEAMPQETEHAGPQETEHAGPQETEHAGPQETEHAGPQETEHAGPQETEHAGPQETEQGGLALGYTVERVNKLQKHIMRYQQLFATFAIRRTLQQGLNGGIIWHTQGSGKTALTYYNVRALKDYYSKQNTPIKFYFIVDRIDLLEQAQMEFAERGLIVRTFDDRSSVMEDFKKNVATENDKGQDEIAVINIQKFATDGSHITKKEIYSTNLKRIFFIDEAHRGYNPKGSFLANLFQADTNSVRIALTGTPLIKEELESWRVFGNYIHTYYYDKSIADGYTLKLMREDIETVYKEEITSILDKLTADIKVKKSDIDHNTIIEHENYCNAVLKYIVHDMKRSRIQQDSPHMGGMIVCETNQQARVMYKLLNHWVEPVESPEAVPLETEQGRLGIAAETEQGRLGMAAEQIPMYPRYRKPLQCALILHDEGSKEERKDAITLFKKTTQIDVLIVNAMLLTGFDAPRLKKLYLMRKLDGHNLLQALTRVNRLYEKFRNGYVVDFANIKDNFIETNNLYMKELNRTNDNADDNADYGQGAGNVLLVSNEEIKEQLDEIKSTLFNYATENLEDFSRQIEGIEDKETLYKLRHTLEDAKALTNQVRSFGDDELKAYFQKMEIGAIPALIGEVGRRIERINLLESSDHKADVSGIIREALDMMEFNIKYKGSEELQIYYNDLKERYNNVECEFSQNFDHDEEAYISLSEDFRRYFAKKGFTPDTVEAAKEDIGYMDAVMQKIKAINRANAALKAKYRGDEKFARLHKRIKEENEKRAKQAPKAHVLISENEVRLATGLNAIKQAIDDKVYLDYNKMNNQGFFDQLVMVNLATQLQQLGVQAERNDRQWLRSKIASEYLEGYRAAM